MIRTLPRVPNACRSAAASALGDASQKINDLAREAVGCNGVFGAPASLVRVPSACADHTSIVSHLHNGPRSEPRQKGITPSTTGFDRNHVPHNGRSSHAWHNGTPAQRALVPHRHNERRHDGAGTTRLQDARFAARIARKGMAITLPRTPNGLPLSCAASIDRESDAVLPAFKMRTISRPRSGVSYSGVLGGSTDMLPR